MHLPGLELRDRQYGRCQDEQLGNMLDMGGRPMRQLIRHVEQ